MLIPDDMIQNKSQNYKTSTESSQKPSAVGAILSTAMMLFAEKSFDAVSIQDIAEQAGVSKANVFHHFPNKDALILAVLQNISLPHAEFAESLLAQQRPCLEKVRDMIHFEVRTLIQHPQILRLLGHLQSRPDQVNCCEKAQQIFQRNIAAVIDLYRQGQVIGEFRADFPAFLPAMLLGGITHLFARDKALFSYMSQDSPTNPIENIKNLQWEPLANDIYQFIAQAIKKN